MRTSAGPLHAAEGLVGHTFGDDDALAARGLLLEREDVRGGEVAHVDPRGALRGEGLCGLPAGVGADDGVEPVGGGDVEGRWGGDVVHHRLVRGGQIGVGWGEWMEDTYAEDLWCWMRA